MVTDTPAWTQEAYRPPCTENSFCCPNWVPPPGGAPYLGGYPTRGVPYPGGTLPGGVPCPGGVPNLGGTLPGGYPTGGDPGNGAPPPSGPGRVPPCLSHGILGDAAKHYGIWVPPPPGWTWPGIPPVCHMEFWVMLQSIMGYGYPPRLDLAGYPPPPPVCRMEFWVMLQSIMGIGTPLLWTDRWMEGQTRVKTLPSRRTTYAGGNNATFTGTGTETV